MLFSKSNSMTHTFYNKLLAVIIALSIIVIMFLNNSVYAESTVKNSVTINGVEYINEKVTTDGTNKTDIDVKVKNNEGYIKYNVNGEEKTIQISPKQNNTSNNEDSDKDVNSDTAEKLDDNEKDNKDDRNEEKDNELKEVKKSGNLIEQVMKLMDNFFAKLSDLFNS